MNGGKRMRRKERQLVAAPCFLTSLIVFINIQALSYLKLHFHKAWISSYYGDGDRPPFQAHVRSAQYPQDVNDFSVIQFQGYWRDNNPSREMCVALGDPRSRARYESSSSNPGCGQPWFDPKTGNTNGICDNKDPFVNGQVGAPAYDPPDPINPFMLSSKSSGRCRRPVLSPFSNIT